MNDNSQNVTPQGNAEETASGFGQRPVPRFALIIGIDGYSKCQQLRGAVADAKAMKEYLQDEHGLSDDRIVALYNEAATRDAMIAAFKGMKENVLIEKGDPIVIFYAGHGSELAAPPAWRLKGVTQCLLPQDYSEPTHDEDGEPTKIFPIPDRTVGVLIEDIAKAKGDNILVIFDCCHSASGTRYPDADNEDSDAKDLEEGYVPRTVKLTDEIPWNLDIKIWGLRAGKFPGDFAFHGLRSHVLLAACGEKEKAYEHEGRGEFTRTLLEALRNCALNDITYTQILERVHLKKQHPHCEGINRHRALFDTRVPAGRHVWHPVLAEDGKYVIGSGLSHGIGRGVGFTLYNNQRLLLGSVPVDDTASIEEFNTTIIPKEHLTDVSFAKVVRVGKIPLHLENRSVLETLQMMGEDDTVAANFRVVDNIEEAKLRVATGGDTVVVLRLLDDRLDSLGLINVPHKVAPKNLPQALGAAAHYYWYLDLKNKKNNLGSNREVGIDFYFLNKEYDDFGTPFFYPTGSTFCRKDLQGNSDIIDFVFDGQGRYGIEVKNNTPRDLYVNAFLFNNSSLSIIPWYSQGNVSSKKTDAPLKKYGTFTIGYGPGGAAPLSFSLEDDQDIDISYLKLFLATRPLDLSDVEQASPFSSIHAPPLIRRRVGGKTDVVVGGRHIWFTFVIPVVQRRWEKGAMEH